MVYAVDIREAFPPAKFGPGGTETSVGSLVNLIVPLLTMVGGFIFLAMGLYGAFVRLTAGGDEEKMQKSQAIFRTSIIGFIIMLAAYGIVKAVAFVFKVSAPI